MSAAKKRSRWIDQKLSQFDTATKLDKEEGIQRKECEEQSGEGGTKRNKEGRGGGNVS